MIQQLTRANQVTICQSTSTMPSPSIIVISFVRITNSPYFLLLVTSSFPEIIIKLRFSQISGLHLNKKLLLKIILGQDTLAISIIRLAIQWKEVFLGRKKIDKKNIFPNPDSSTLAKWWVKWGVTKILSKLKSIKSSRVKRIWHLNQRTILIFCSMTSIISDKEDAKENQMVTVVQQEILKAEMGGRSHNNYKD